MIKYKNPTPDIRLKVLSQLVLVTNGELTNQVGYNYGRNTMLESIEI